MTENGAPHPSDYGYARWVHDPYDRWLSPDGLRVLTAQEAIAEHPPPTRRSFSTTANRAS
jgi:hypothetical protein